MQVPMNTILPKGAFAPRGLLRACLRAVGPALRAGLSSRVAVTLSRETTQKPRPLRRSGPTWAAWCAAVMMASVAMATPTISFVTPTSGSTIPLATTPGGVTVTVNASPTASSSIVSVQLFDNGSLVGTASGSSPFNFNWAPSTSGTHTLSATVTDTSTPTTGASASSNTATVNSFVTVTVARAVTIATSASHGGSIAQGSEVFLRSSAAFSDAIVGKVEFFLDRATTNTLLTSKTQAPYNVPYVLSVANGFTAGAHTITAVATSSDNSVVVSSTDLTVNIAAPFTGNQAPVVNLTAPPSGAVFLNQNITVSATATDGDGFIPSTAGGGVTFLVDGDPITPATTGETNPDLIAPYAVTWRPTVAKSYSIRAQTIDDRNRIVLSGATIVTASAAVPTVTVIAPSSAVTGASVSLSATASPSSGATITQVEFLVDGVVVATDPTAPYAGTWTASTVGTHSITARVTDSNGSIATSSVQTINVTAVPGPSATLTLSPAAAVGTASTITATATTGGGNTVSSVQFFVNGVSLGTDAASPFTATWTPTSTGTFSLTAQVVDSSGAVGNATPLSVTVGSPAGPLGLTIALTGSATIPAGSTRVVTATTTGGGAIDRIELYFDGGTLVDTDTTAPYSFLFTAPSGIGTHNLTARAFETSGGEAQSNAIPITLTAAVGVLPTASIQAPVSGAMFATGAATTISGTASDSDGTVTGVQVFVNGSTAGLANNGVATLAGSAWSIAWTPSGLGSASITAIATDNSGNSVAAAAGGITITDTTSPAITLSLSPRTAATPASTTLPGGAVRNIVADVTPAAGRAVVRVEFFVDGTKVAEDTTPPYTHRFTAPSLGAAESSRSVVVSARATDNAGAARDAHVALLVVSALGSPPAVSLLSPTNNATVVPNTPVSLAATAIASGGAITSVQFYVNGSPASVNGGNGLITAPYMATFTPQSSGTFVLEAIATDDRGNTGVSNAVTITAAFATPTVAISTPNPASTARATPAVPVTITSTVTAGTGSTILLAELLLDGVPIASRTSPTSGTAAAGTYSFAWTPDASLLGAHVLTVRVTDTNSQTATSLPLNVNVANVVGTPPTITITSPANNATVQSLSTVNFTANTSASATSVEFFLNEQSLGLATREQTANTFRLTYNFGNYNFSALTPTIDPNTGNPRYALTLYAIARDANGNQTVTPATTPLTFNIVPSQSLPPSVQLVPLSPATVTAGTIIAVGALTADPDGTPTQLQLFANGATTPLVTVQNPNNPLLQFTLANAGRYNVYAVITDDTGNTSVSAPTVFTVTGNAAPTVTLVRPTDDSTVTSVNTPVFLEATARDADVGQTVAVTFINTATGATLAVGTRVGTTDTYRAIWTPTQANTFTVAARATDNANGNTNSSAVRRVVVNNVTGIAPTVTISLPTTSTTASTANFTATASDSDGSVIGVEFFLNRNKIGDAVRDQQTNTWRLTASYAGVPPGTAEVVALARDSSGNVAASPTTNVTVNAASSIAPSITISPSTTDAPFNRQVQLTANARDTDGTITSVQYFANATSLGTSGNAGTNFQVTWTPTVSGPFNVWAIATDNSGNTTVSPTVVVTVRRNNPVQEDAAFIVQTYQDIANITSANINPLVFADLDARLDAGTLTRAELIVGKSPEWAGLLNEPAFATPVNVLAAYYVLMGQWPTPANYTAVLNNARNNGLAAAIGAAGQGQGTILGSNEYFAKFGGVVPTTGLLNNPASAIPADLFITRLWQSAGLGTPSAQDNVAFRSNTSLQPTLGRGYNSVGLQQALLEFITNTNSRNTALFDKARAAALYYQLDRPPVTVTVDQITARIAALVQMGEEAARALPAGAVRNAAFAKPIAEAVLTDVLYGYRYVTITRDPESVAVTPRAGALFRVEATGQPPLSYQWLLNGAPIPGATSSVLSLTNVDATRVGTYTVVVTSAQNSATSDAATLTLSNVATRLANISTRGVTTGGANLLIGGFVVQGTGTQSRQMLIRVVGPTLGAAPFNVTGVLADPRLEVYRGAETNPIAQNDNWGAQAGGAAAVTALQQATTRAGAFALANGSADAAVLVNLAPGSYTVQATGPNANASGVVLLEVYDVTTGAATTVKAINVSTRGQVGTGANTLIAGFVVQGEASRRVLIRGVGPTLSRFGLPAGSLLANPQLTLVNQATGQTIRTNDDWATGDDAALIAQAATTAGAFALQNGSLDAAMIVMLPPGAYTAQLSGVNGGTGIGIVEVYDVDR